MKIIILNCLLIARLERRQLTEKDLIQIRNETPALKKGSRQLFRNLRDKGTNLYLSLFC